MDYKLLTFIPPYRKSQFYQLMGHFFAERQYRHEYPYLINSEKTCWYIIIDHHVIVRSFASFEVKNSKIEIGDFYVSGNIKKKNMKQLLMKKILMDIKRDFPEAIIEVSTSNLEEKELFENKGFEVVRRTKNYFFLRKKGIKVYE